MNNLDRLADCCRVLESGKIKESRTQAEKMILLLDNPDVVNALDLNSERKERMSWDRLFCCVKVYMLKEAEHFRGEKPNANPIALAQRKQRRADCCNKIRHVIRRANEKEIRLKTLKLVNFLTAATQDEFTWQCFSVEYSYLFLDEILGNHKVSREIPFQALMSFIELYLDMFKIADSNYELIMQILEKLIYICSVQYTLDYRLLFDFFKDAIVNYSKKLTVTQQQSMMSACYAFCVAVCTDCRLQLCSLGEDVLETVIQMLGGTLSKRFKSILIGFLQLQMSCHHPNGASSEEHGMLVVDKQLWRGRLHDLYEVLMNELQQSGSRNKNSAGKQWSFEPDVLDLVVSVCHQEFEAVVVHGDVDEPGTSTKRCRQMAHLQKIIDQMQTVGIENCSIIGWLQLVGALFKRFPNVLACSEDLTQLIQLLHQIVLDCKSYVTMGYLLDCLHWVFLAFKSKESKWESTKSSASMAVLWTKIYEVLLRSVSLNHCVPEGHALLQQFIVFKPVKLTSELKCLYTPGISPVSPHSLMSLATIMKHSKLRVLKGKTSTLASTSQGNCEPEDALLDVRIQLVEWLLPSLVDDGSAIPSRRNEQMPFGLMGEVLVGLFLQDCRSIFVFVENADESSALPAVEISYLQSFTAKVVRCNRSSEKLTLGKSSVITVVKDKVIQCLLRDCGYLLDPAIAPESNDVLAVGAQCCLVAKCLGCMVKHEVISALQLAETPLCDVLQKLMLRFTKLLLKLCRRDSNAFQKMQTLTPAIAVLQQLYSWDGDDKFCKMVTQFCREMTSEMLLDLLFNLLYGNAFPSSCHSSIKGRTSNEMEKPDSDQLEASCSVGNSSREPGPIGNLRKLSTVVDGGINLLTAPLDDVENLQLKVAQLLITICQHSRPPLLSPMRHPAASMATAGENNSVQTRLLSPFTQLGFDMYRPFNVQLVVLVLNKLLQPEQELNERHFDLLLDVLRKMCKLHFKDGEVSSVCLEILAKLSLRLEKSSQENKQKAMHLISGFWDLKVKKKCGPLVELGIAKVIAALAKCQHDVHLMNAVNYAGDNNDESQLSPACLPKFLECRSFALSSFAAVNISLLFKDNEAPVMGNVTVASIHGKMLTLVLHSIRESGVGLDGSLKAKDFQQNWTASALLALANIATASPFCLKEALLAMCTHAKEIPLSLNLVKKAIQNVAADLKYPTLRGFIEAHLGYLVHHRPDNDFTKFLWHLSDAASEKDFLKQYYLTIVPHVYTDLDEVNRDSFSKALALPWTSMVEECFPHIMAFVLPTLFAASSFCAPSSSATMSAAEKRKASVCLQLLGKTLTQKVVDKLLASRLHEIVVAVLKCIYVVQPDAEAATFLPEPNPPFFSPYFISGAFQYVIASCNEKNTSLITVLSRTQDGLQNVLLALNVILESSHEVYEIYRSLLMHVLFVRLVLDEFGTGLNGSWAFVLQDIIHVLAHQLARFHQSGLRDHALLASSLLSDTVRKSLSVCPGEFCKHLPVVVNCLLPYLKNDGTSAVATQVLAILDSIFIAEKPLKKALDRLEPFPAWPALKVINNKHSALKCTSGTLTLQEEIQNFLQVVKTRLPIRRLEGLQHIARLLASRRDEFKELVAELESAYFSDECKKSTLYMLIIELLYLCTSATSDSEVACCAAKCLGEVGPVPVSSVVLQVDPPENESHNALRHFSGDATSQCHTMVLHTLHSYLIGSCVRVKSVASETLKKLLRTKTGFDFCTAYRAKKLGFLFEYLHPFTSKKQPSLVPVSPVSEEDFISSIDTHSLWSPEQSRHGDWIGALVCTLIDCRASRCEIIQELNPVCRSKVEFCETLLPYLIHAILKNDTDGTYRAVLSRQINDLFSKFCDQSNIAGELSTTASTLPLVSSASLGPAYNDRKSIQVMLDVVKFLRLQNRPKVRGSTWTIWDNNFWLDLNYLWLAKAAYMSCAYFTALLFAEIWWDVKVKNSENQQIGPGNGSNGSISSCSSEDGSAAQSLMLGIYRRIGDPDAIYGCGASHLTDPCRRLHFYEEEQHWQRALCAYDLALQSNMPVSQKGMLQAMYKMGLHHLPQNYLQNLSRNFDLEEKMDDMKEFEYQCAWKLTQWSLPSPSYSSLEESAPAFDSSVYESLLSLRENNESRFQDGCRHAYQAVIKKLQLGCLESSGSLYLPMAQLSALNRLENSFKLKIRNNNDGLQSAFTKWTEDNTMFYQDYDVMEPIISMQDSVLQLLLTANPQNAFVRTELVECLERQARFARENGLSQWAETYIVRLRNIPGIPSEKKLAWKFEEARIFWANSERETAKSLLCVLIEELDKKAVLKKSSLYARSLAVYGDWLIETSSESASVVLENYFEKSIAMQEKQELSENLDFLLDTYLATARYADTQYQRAAKYVTSSEYQWKRDMILRSNDAAVKLRAKGPKNLSLDQRKALITLERQADIDRRELQSTQERKQKYLLQAIRNYIGCLRIGERHDNRVFRLVSLWFDNSDFEELNQLMMGSISSIPSHKFLPLMYQLAARMSAKAQKNSFNSTLTKLILQLTKDHPYHTIHVIMALSNASKDEQYLAPQAKTQKGAVKQDEDRVLAAKQVLEKLRSGPLGETIQEMDSVCDALMQFSYWQPPDTKATGAFKIPSTQRITKVRGLTRVPPLTMTIKVDPACKYENVPGILRFEPDFKFCGGVNAPKQVQCLGSDGRKHIELIKGRDDLRQDAVMQQVFAMVNYLLRRSPETSRRKLHIRTYKVVPLSQRSGILQWCDNTKPLGQYLAVENAHKRINPNDWLVNKCRRQIMENGGEKPDQKLKIYLEICDNFKPVFHHFFLENFPDPPSWFEKRTAYIKSVATNSIVGYILGLGDRHVHNILIDLQTAELIHIDLGVAFDQGKLLPTPETVPFRLTRDIVDGMGSMGTEGIFRRCCEKTMQVMHSSQEVIVTILEVLLYDPLYEWTLSPLKACELQNQRDDFDRSTTEAISLSGVLSTATYNQSLEMEDQNSSPKSKDVNKLAERVLLRLQEKLQGKEDDTILSVAGQVAHLIQQAGDPANLCRLFHGWQAYL